MGEEDCGSDTTTNCPAAPAADLGAHYRYQYRGIKLDPYRVMRLYEITDPAHQHAVKKLLRAGRGKAKGLRQDIVEVVMTLERWLEMIDEDESHG